MALTSFSLGAWNERYNCSKLDALVKSPSCPGFASIFANDLFLHYHPTYTSRSIWSDDKIATLALQKPSDAVLDFFGPDFDSFGNTLLRSPPTTFDQADQCSLAVDNGKGCVLDHLELRESESMASPVCGSKASSMLQSLDSSNYVISDLTLWASELLYELIIDYALPFFSDHRDIDSYAVCQRAAMELDKLLVTVRRPTQLVVHALYYLSLVFHSDEADPMPLVELLDQQGATVAPAVFIRQTFLVGAVLADKWLNDGSFSLKTWSLIAKEDQRDLQVLERTFLKVIKYHMWVRSDEYISWLQFLQEETRFTMHEGPSFVKRASKTAANVIECLLAEVPTPTPSLVSSPSSMISSPSLPSPLTPPDESQSEPLFCFEEDALPKQYLNVSLLNDIELDELSPTKALCTEDDPVFFRQPRTQCKAFGSPGVDILCDLKVDSLKALDDPIFWPSERCRPVAPIARPSSSLLFAD